ncbi:MAG: cytochrome c peroxidase [Thiofilum sp.]|uniref:cytochrome-c peroxidase n=1 Tax=Thiofilum sp. TaxID=2212733 RepID=UPI0025DA494A|nr:cytochrome c peroxidase [Thiofilum sp.]MBK8453734.1 hypothetical protein [Thiofilum sp.]
MSTNPTKPILQGLIALVLSLSLVACETKTTQSQTPSAPTTTISDSSVSLSDLDRELLPLVSELQLTGDPSQGRTYPPAQDSLVQLGKQLFFQPYKAQGASFSCAQCHDPLQGGTLRQPLATGLAQTDNSREVVPDYLFHRGRSVVPARNAPTTFNMSLWDVMMFHDGRVQALKPNKGANGSTGGISTPNTSVAEPDPQAGRNLVQAAAQLTLLRSSLILQKASSNEASLPNPYTLSIDQHLDREQQRFSLDANLWLSRFRQGFNTPDGLPLTLVTHDKIAEALAAYMRSQVFINNPWKHYLEGDPNAISETAKQGALLFFRNPQQGGFGCARCHSGDTFTDENLYRTLIPTLHLKHPLRALPDELDYGRWFITREDKDKFSFRTPSLLNVTETGPWGHNGAYVTLSAMVRHMLDPVAEASQYDATQLTEAALAADHLVQGINTMLFQGIDLTSQKYSQKELQALLAFLHTLTDPCIKDPVCLKPWLPD